jgi:hypothetical protein
VRSISQLSGRNLRNEKGKHRLPNCLPTASVQTLRHVQRRTVCPLQDRCSRVPTVDGMEEVRGSSPLSSAIAALLKPPLGKAVWKTQAPAMPQHR